MNAALGAWKNAPLAYVLAEVRTEQVADLADHQAALATIFRSEYPIQRNLHSAKFIATNSGIASVEQSDETAWEFATPDNSTALIFRRNGLVLHATKYTSSVEFLARLHRAVKTLVAEIPNIFVNQFGLRYVDFVLPDSGETPDDYVDIRLNPTIGDNGNSPLMAMSLAIYPFDNGGMLSLRYLRAKGQPELPPDLTTFALEKSVLMKKEGLSAEQPTAIIDTDVIRPFPTRKLLDPDSLLGEFKEMRAMEAEYFSKIITKHARSKWGAT